MLRNKQREIEQNYLETAYQKCPKKNDSLKNTKKYEKISRVKIILEFNSTFVC